MKILVTGATGFLGGALTETLLRAGHEVRILARPTSRRERFNGLPVDLRIGALDDLSSLATLCRDIDVIYHCAALSSDWGPWNDFYRANVLGVQNLLEAAREATGLRRLLHVSTTDVYGYPVEAVDETYPITDTGLPYNRSKGLGEKLVWEAHRQSGLPVTVIRPATIYGPRSLSIVAEIAGLLRKKEMALIDGGRVPAGLLYIDNAVAGMIQAAESPLTIGQAYNLRDESNETWRKFVHALADGMKVRRPWINLPGQPALALARVFEAVNRALRIKKRPLLTRHATYLLCRTQGYSIGKAQRDFNFQSTIDFAEGMRRTQAWLASKEGQALFA